MYLGTEELHEPASKEPADMEITGERLANILAEHGKWVESRGEAGETPQGKFERGGSAVG